MKHKGQRRFSFNLFTAFCFIMAIAVLAQGGSAFAGTNVSGPISANATWFASSSPYTVTGAILVKPGATLTIEPGVTVNFNAGMAIMIDGGLIAKGTAAQKITFTSTIKDTAPEYWGYIYFRDSAVDAEVSGSGVYKSGSIMEHCIVEYAGANNVPALKLEKAQPFINYCTFRNNKYQGIYGDLTNKLYITNCQITSNGNTGIDVGGNSSKVISGNTVESNKGDGINSSGSSSFYSYIQNNIVKKNENEGIECSYATVSGNTVSENGSYYSGLYASYSTITKNTITNNKNYGIFGHSNSIIENIITGNIKYGINSYGGPISKNTISSNGGGVYSGGGNSKITNNTITKNTAETGSGIYSSSDKLISNNTLTENKATKEGGATIYISSHGFDSFALLVNKNLIYSNTGNHELYENQSLQSSKLPLDATNNWWGTAVDYEIQGKIYDYYDAPTQKHEVSYSPFANSLNDIPVPPDASFTTAVSGLTVKFSDTSTPINTINSWSWKFGDGETSTEQNPSHTYEAEGPYPVELTVTSNDGTDTETGIISVGTVTPAAISVSPANKDVPSSAGTTSFAVSNTGSGTMAWTAAVTSGTWLTITSGSSGSNTGTINCSYTANATASARTATVRVTAAGATGSPKDVTVSQAAGSTQAILTISPASRTVPNTAGTTSFAVSNTGTGTMAWTAAVNSGTWLTIVNGQQN